MVETIEVFHGERIGTKNCFFSVARSILLSLQHQIYFQFQFYFHRVVLLLTLIHDTLSILIQ